ncbi:D-aminoacyl-tRNA deacylase [Corynebacterium antarcticum]|uniref:D-aminoacyl-tRNA deacylase n=1 Tax=Corynebacterium antarcticum TaxID=2800405 RepID=UPI002002CF83|nr:D-aminoacyl-tRNA deacylase [Corynebacterium antarcticum]MCK7641575.1 D-aminoacyl-tRNA deacylase [Corynebacterium antarcticum]MCK7660327.1 D-aminoacyl-tRNA deacylase [Corynebacterium antarcticum]MCX7491176.1 D-aminoacyl-tRNA deacylase [Corynebacterium antarcticum]MCX7539641.1 D-aminoacyl-tRNA deacylase [Corynebacterium antarcticum]
MKAVLTRVSRASVTVDDEVVGEINCPDTCGLLALVGVARGDGEDPSRVETMVRKIAELRILPDEQSVESVGAPVLLVSQFTLQGRTAKGRRPSWSDAAPGGEAEPVIAAVAEGLRARGISVAEGRFGAMMRVSSVNEGPFTVLVDC